MLTVVFISQPNYIVPIGKKDLGTPVPVPLCINYYSVICCLLIVKLTLNSVGCFNGFVIQSFGFVFYADNYSGVLDSFLFTDYSASVLLLR